MATHIQVEHLQKIFRIPVREPGMKAAWKSLVHPHYDMVKAVSDISFSIKRGEVVGFIGQNGAGKTTTLKMLSGLLFPTSGNVTAAGFTPWDAKRNIFGVSAC